MSQFHYTAIKPSGQRVRGTLRTRTRREALAKLREMSYHPLALVPAGEVRPGLRDLSFATLRRITTSDLAVLTRQLAALLKAGLPMIQALRTLRRQCANPRLASVLADLEETLVRDAGTLADALDNHPRVFDGVYRGLVRSGEEGGHLGDVLHELAGGLARAARVRGQVVGAFIYPIFLLWLGALAVFVLMTFVIPRFQELFTAFGQSLPWPTRALIAVSVFLDSWWWAVLGGVAVGLGAVLLSLRRLSTRRHAHQLLLALPVLGSMIQKIEIARLARTLGALLGGGVRILEALRITRDTARNLVIRDTFSHMIRGVTAGQSVAEVMERTARYPPLVVNLVRTGEDTGELPEMLGELAAIYDDEADRAVAASVKLLEPLLIVGMGLVIAAIVAAVILPVFQSSAMTG